MKLSRKNATPILACLAVMTCHVRSDANSDGWGRFYNAFKQQIGGDPQGITFMTTPRSIGSDVATTGGFEQYELCNQAPEWSFSYKPVGDVFNAYKEFTDSFAYVANKEALDQAFQAEKQMGVDQLAYNNCMQGLTAQWLQFHNSQSALPPTSQTTYEDWMTDNGAPLCKPKKDLYVASSIQYQKYLQAAMHSGYDYVRDAWDALATPDNYISLFTGSATVNVSQCAFSPNFLSTLQGWQHGTKNAGSFSVSSTDSASSDWQFSAVGEAGLFIDPVAIGGEGSYKRHEIDTSSSSFKLTVSWDAMETFTMSRGKWYNSALLQGHKSGPFQDDSPIAKGITKLWGKGGELGLVPQQAVVMYHQGITLSMDESTYNKVKTDWHQTSGGCVFIFCFETHTSSSKTTVKFHDDSFSFEMVDTSTIPKVVAIVNSVNEPPTLAENNAKAEVAASMLKAAALPEKVLLHDDCDAPTVEFFKAGAVSCNDPSIFPNLSPQQFNCIQRLDGIKVHNTPAWTLLYLRESTQSLAHFNYARNTGGNSAHFTCRQQDAYSGHHVGADSKSKVLSWLRNGCCQGSGWPNKATADMQKLVAKISTCLP